MKITDPQFAAAVRKTLINMNQDRHVISYYSANVLLAIVARSVSLRRYVRFANLDGFAWGFRDTKSGDVLVGCLSPELTTPEAKSNGGCFVTDLNAHEVKTKEVHHTPLDSEAHARMLKRATGSK